MTDESLFHSDAPVGAIVDGWRRVSHEEWEYVLSLDALTDRLRAFARDRDWERYHTPRGLAESISIEAAELLELFQWGREPTPESLEDELADVLIYLVRLADVAGVDLLEAVDAKMGKNAEKYPSC